jgi:long-chain acyl-CoA synthetase
MLKLLQAALSNPNFSYFDVNQDRSYSLKDLLIKEPLHENAADKSLTFLYLDNSILSVSAFWNFYSLNSALVLLSDQLNDSLKNQLEELYSPDYIFDVSRTLINGYLHSKWFELPIFSCKQDRKNKNIHPEIKILLSTSGTTGSPKFVKLSDENLYQNALSIIDYLPINKNDVTPLNLPIYYSYGLSVLTTNSMVGGQIITSLEDILSKKFWFHFEKLKFTSLAGVPYTYEVLNRIGFTQKHYTALKYLTQAGGKLSNKLTEIFADYSESNSLSFYVMYGQTEATARMSFLSPENLKNKTGSIGKPIKNGDFKIDNNTGELIYMGPNIFGGYAQNPSDLSTFETNIELHTGDIAKVDEDDGFYYITGRIKRFAKIIGSRVNLDELEEILKNTFANSTFACVGQNDKNIFIGYDNTEIKDNQIKEHIKNILNIHPTFIKVKLIEKFPLTANGKINYTQLSELYGHL